MEICVQKKHKNLPRNSAMITCLIYVIIIIIIQFARFERHIGILEDSDFKALKNT